ncbi:hypothetical protein L6164_023813 [Bauhinia variegata]|uniref:Uncharacterized protein n=1 Tax=Bauhinia variegata TaxID=167791 RepID=A0ACB9MPN2_BAUVA|nr:hypothetical protein L6164_023813 [Bauhinia variegata]
MIQKGTKNKREQKLDTIGTNGKEGQQAFVQMDKKKGLTTPKAKLIFKCKKKRPKLNIEAEFKPQKMAALNQTFAICRAQSKPKRKGLHKHDLPQTKYWQIQTPIMQIKSLSNLQQFPNTNSSK